ncbi:DoxX family protein [Actinophytocola sp. NPDC049390]|uniref:DoxX family protein n=1 Tax=Actinophytocola sp. NPDC049390 TaxID=3363894 RepID=UPI003791F22E
MNRVRLLCLLVGAGLLAVVGWFWVRAGLRPLRRIEETAAAIAGGDLSRRVPPTTADTTEVGRLTASPNGMLAQIEAAVAARARSEERLRRFVADASHEPRTPLAGISGFAQLYRMGGAEIDATMDRIERESLRLTGLVDDLLLLAQLDERGLSLRGAPTPRLPPEAAAKVFDRFYRADTSRTRDQGGGAGLGLAIVWSLVTAHGGEVALETKPGARHHVPGEPADGAVICFTFGYHVWRGRVMRSRTKENLMNLALWITTGLLAAVALLGGMTKSFLPKEKLAASHGGEWTAGVSTGFVRTLGVLELLAAVGLTVPAVVDVAPVMVPVTAVCWILLMVGAMVTHGRLGQYKLVLLNVVYLGLAAFIAWGRFDLAPFTA